MNAVIESPEDQTPQELFLEMLEVKRERYESTKNMWDKYAYEQLKKWGETHFDLEGQELPTDPVVAELAIQVSAPEVVAAEGWFNVLPNLYDMPPKIITNNMGDPNAGIDLSASRSNGAFLVQNQEETAQDWINNTADVAKKYSISERVVKMAGHNMAGLRYLLPTQNWGGTYGYDNFAIVPEVPFNEGEDELWWKNWKALHIVSGVNFITRVYYVDTEAKPRVAVDSAGKHRIFISPNHPQWVVPSLMAYFNSAIFKNRALSVARSLAHQIDAGQKAPVAGYEKVTVTGSDKTKWYAANGETTDQTKQPKFSKGRER